MNGHNPLKTQQHGYGKKMRTANGVFVKRGYTSGVHYFSNPSQLFRLCYT